MRSPRQKGENRTVAQFADMMRITDALSQALTAASNYMGTARLLLLSAEANANVLAVENLEHAEVQIVRAGAIFGQFREHSD